MTPESAEPAELKWPWLFAAGVGGVCGLLHILGRGEQGFAGEGFAIGQMGLYAAPVFLGVLGGLFLRTDPVLKSLGLSLACLVVAGPMMGEGLYCLVMIVPVHLVLTPLVAFGVSRLAASRRRHLPRAAGIELLLLLVPFGGAAEARWHPVSPPPPVTMVDSVEVAATPEEVWASIDRLQLTFAGQAPWLLRAGLPVPLEIDGGGTAPGSRRRVVFSNGTVVATVTGASAPRWFSVALTVEPRGREFFDHWSILGTSRFDFTPMADGGTRITHSTTYTPLSVPRWYFEPAERFLGARVQRYMLEAYAQQAWASGSADPALAAR